MQDSAAFAVDYYFSDKIWERTAFKAETNIYQSAPEDVIRQLGQKKYDLVIIGTAHRHFNIYKKITAQFRTAVIVHNRNFSESRAGQLLLSVKNQTGYRLKLLLKERLLQAPAVYKNAAVLFVLSRKMARSGYRFLPLFFSSENPSQHNEILKIAIPGSVSQSRRDYRGIIQQIKEFAKPAEIVFLGKAAGEELEWLRILEKEKPDDIQLRYFTSKVSQKEFGQILSEADVLWCPVQKQTEFFGIKEYYGQTKMSGNIGDAIKFGKPALFSPGTGDILPFILEGESSEETLHHLSQQNFDFSDFKKEKIRAELEALLIEIC